MSEQMEQCENCLKSFPESKIATHFGYCRRNIKKCQKCGEMYDINFQDEHQQEFHKRIGCQYCKKEFGTAQIDSHTKNCTQKPRFCQYCQLNVPPLEFPAHLRQCQSRTKKCDQCRQQISNKQYLFHISTCKGPIEEIKQPSRGYGDHIQEQRAKMGAQMKKQYARVNYQYKPHEQKVQSQGYRKKEISQKDIELENYKKEKQKIVDKYSRNPQGNQPISSYGISKPSVNPTNPIGGARSRQSKETVPSSKNIVSGNGVRQQVNPTRNYQYNKQPSAKIPINQPTRVTGHVGSIGSRPLRQDPPKMNSRETKPTYPNPPSTYKPSVPNSVPNQPSKYSSNSYKAPSGQVPSSGISKNVQAPISMPKPRNEPKKNWDPSSYGGYVDDDNIPQEVFAQGYANQRINNNPNAFELDGGLSNQDEQLQKAIMMSMGLQQKKGRKHHNIPKELDNEDCMNQSFYKDMDVEKQKALYEEAQSKYRKY